MRITFKIKVALYEGGKRIEDATLNMEYWGASGWRIWGNFRRQPDQQIKIEGRGSYGMQAGKFYPATLMGDAWEIIVPTEKFLRERRICWLGGDMSSTRLESYDQYFPTLDEALAYLKIGAVLCAVAPHDPGGETVVLPLMIGKMYELEIDHWECGGDGWIECAKPQTFKPVAAEVEGDKFFVHASDGRDAQGWISDGEYILHEINGIRVRLHPEITRIEQAAQILMQVSHEKQS